MASDTTHILNFENVDKREVALALQTWKRRNAVLLTFLLGKGLTVEELITDASSAVAKMLGMYSVFIVGTLFY